MSTPSQVRITSRRTMVLGAGLCVLLAGLAPLRAETLLLPESEPVKVAPLAPPAPANPAGVSVKDLLERASQWRQRGRSDLAQSLLDQVLKTDPANLDALFQAGLVAIDAGDTAKANAYLARMTEVAPGDVRVERMKMALARGQISAERIETARALARSGDSAAAVAAYRDAFAGLPPPLEYALEYYIAMAGTEAGWAEARTRIQAMAAKSPDDVELQLAYARVLTYREVTRRDGIRLLARLAARSPDADRSWRDALLWLDAGRADEALFKAYSDAHPDDGDVSGRWAQVIEPMKPDTAVHAVTLAYGAVAERNYAEAEALFLKALAFDPNNTNALTGMAGLRMRVGRSGEAMDYMKRAIAIEPTLREEYHDLYDAARFLNDYNAAAAAARAGRHAQAERLLRPLVAGRAKERSIAVALLASVLANQKKYAEAEKYYREALRLRPRDRTVVTGLYRVLVARGKPAEAEALAAQVPADVRAEVGRSLVQAEAQAAVVRAEARARAGDVPGALEAYAEAITKAPDDPWTRLAYARLLRRQGQADRAEEVMRPVLAKQTPAAADFHVAALFALDRDRLQEAGALINAIPGPERTADIKKLSEEIALRTTLQEAKRALAGGDRTQAQAALRMLSARDDLDPGLWGVIAGATADMGDTDRALAIARRELAKPVPAGAGLSTYSGLIGIVTRYGGEGETRTLIARFRPMARTAEEIRLMADIEAGLVGAEADRMRQAGQIRPAFDLLMPQLRRDPQNTTLLAALARVYASAKMYDEADRIYADLLTRTPEDADLALQAVWVAISLENWRRARDLIDPLLEQGPPSSQLHFAEGILLRAEGDNGGAIRALEKAKELRARELGVSPTSLAPLSSNTDGLPPLPNFL